MTPGAQVRTLKGDGSFYKAGCTGAVTFVHPLSGNVLVVFERGEFKRCAGDCWWARPENLEEIQ